MNAITLMSKDPVLFVTLRAPAAQVSMGTEFAFGALKSISIENLESCRLPENGEEFVVIEGSKNRYRCINVYGPGTHRVEGHSAVIYALFVEKK